MSSDDDLEEVETAWTDVLEGIDDRPFGAAAVPGCTFVLPEETFGGNFGADGSGNLIAKYC